jgi:hypothetical protein
LNLDAQFPDAFDADYEGEVIQYLK